MKTIARLNIEIFDIELDNSEFSEFMSKIDALISKGSSGGITISYENIEVEEKTDDDLPF